MIVKSHFTFSLREMNKNLNISQNRLVGAKSQIFLTRYERVHQFRSDYISDMEANDFLFYTIRGKHQRVADMFLNGRLRFFLP